MQPDIETRDPMNDQKEPSVIKNEVQDIRKSSLIVVSLYILFGVLLLILLTGILTFFSAKALPGEQSYAVKTGIIENIISYTKFGTSAQSLYDIERLKNRLSELKILSSDKATTTPEVLGGVATLIDSHTTDALATLKAAAVFPHEDKINTLATLSEVVNTEAALTDNVDEFAFIASQVRASGQKVDLALTSAIQTFASSSSQGDVSVYLGIQIKDVSNKISHVAPGSTAQRKAIYYVTHAHEAIVAGNMVDALTSILKARKAIVLDEYLFDSERGAIDDVPADVPSEAPLGT